MSDKRRHIHEIVYNMKIGQEIVFDRHFFHEAFPVGMFSMYRTPIEAFLSSTIGTGCGSVRAEVIPTTGDVRISRHEESDKRYYIDPDREYMFNKNRDGTLSLKPEYQINHQTEGEGRPTDAGRNRVARGE